MVFECVCRRISGTEHFDVEAFIKFPGRKFRGGQFGADQVKKPVGIFGGRFIVDTENIVQFVCQPDATRRTAKKVEILAEQLPDFTVVALDRVAIHARDAQAFQ